MLRVRSLERLVRSDSPEIQSTTSVQRCKLDFVWHRTHSPLGRPYQITDA